jgi:hypothetical protein
MQYFTEHQVQLAVICSLISFAVTHIIKPFIKGRIERDKAAALIRLAAVIMGGVCGFTLSYNIADLWLGAGVGGVNALIVRVVKARLKAQHKI